MTLLVYDPTGTVCAGDGMLSFSGFGLSVGFDISGCTQSVSVGPDATTFTTICPGSVTTAILKNIINYLIIIKLNNILHNFFYLKEGQ